MADKIDPTRGTQTRTVINVTQADDDYTLERHECPALITNQGATGACTVNLPTDAKGGEEVEAVVVAAQDILLNPGSGNRIIGSDGSTYADLADGEEVIGDAAGETIRLVCLGPDGSGNLEWLAVVQHDNSPAAGGSFNEEDS